MVDFAACGANVPLNASMRQLYGYTGPLSGIPRNISTQITLEGCKALCGEGVDLYPWSRSSETILGWVLPIIGVLLGAPFQSNASWSTVFFLARWLGNPITSLSCVLWNIKVTSRCAMIVDMSVPLHDEMKLSKHRLDDFKKYRDSFYILTVMNQFSLKPVVRQNKEAEGLLRIALFSQDLQLLRQDKVQGDAEIHRTQERRDSAMELSSTGIPRAYLPGNGSGSNDSITTSSLPDLEPKSCLIEERRKLAEELRASRKRAVVPVFVSMAWFLFALAVSIEAAFNAVGKQEVAHDLALGLLLSWIPVLVLSSIVDRNPSSSGMIIKKLNSFVNRVRTSLMDERVRGRYNTSIKIDRKRKELMETWVGEISDACYEFKEPFDQFAGQGRLRWHYGCCHPIVRDIEGAFIAREGRDWLCSEEEARTLLVLETVDQNGLNWFDKRELWQIMGALFTVALTIAGAFVLSFYVPTVGLGCRSGGYLIAGINSFALLLSEMGIWWILDAQTGDCESLKRKLDMYFFKPAELLNSGWLIYIVLAQTFGIYQTCECLGSHWGGANYLDLTQISWTISPDSYKTWLLGTIMSGSAMFIAMTYICTQWCLQSHLSTADFRDAATGLRRVQTFRWLISPLEFIKTSTTERNDTLKWSRRISCTNEQHHHNRGIQAV